MTVERIAAMFPNASRDFIAANSGAMERVDAALHPVNAPIEPAVPALPKPKQNKTEAEFGRILEARRARGEIVSYQFEGITLRLADNCKYTPDFFVIESADPLRIIFYETKGAHIWDDARVKFRVAREQNPWATFEMWQRKGGEWTKIL